MIFFKAWKPFFVFTAAFFCTACQFDLNPSLGQNCKANAGRASRASAQDAQLANLTQNVIELSGQIQQGLTDSIREQTYAALALGIEARTKYLASQVKARPEMLFSYQIPSTVKSALPEQMQQCIEKNVEITGTLRILGMDAPGEEQLIRYWIQDEKGTKHEILFSSIPPKLQSGEHLTVKGLYLPCISQLLVVNPADPAALTFDRAADTSENSLPALLASGAQKVAVLLIGFQDQPSFNTITEANDLLFNQVSGYFYENSSQRTWLTGNSFGPYTIPMSKQTCDPDSIATYAKSAAASAGVKLSNYSRIVYVFPANSCYWLGLGTIGGYPSESWINGAFDLDTVAHELGHNFGLYHANAFSCGSTSIGSDCKSVEYADTTDVMGNRVPGHLNAFHKEQLGWLNTESMSSISTLSASGEFDLKPYEATTDAPKAFKVLKSIDSHGAKTYYYIEYRQPIGYDSVFSNLWISHNLTSGIVIHTGVDQNANSSYLLNMNPSQSSWYKSALQPGDSFQDPESGFKVTLLSADPTKAKMQITIGQIPTSPLMCGQSQ